MTWQLDGVRAMSFPLLGSQVAASAPDITSEIKARGGRGGHSPSRRHLPTAVLGMKLCVCDLSHL